MKALGWMVGIALLSIAVLWILCDSQLGRTWVAILGEWIAIVAFLVSGIFLALVCIIDWRRRRAQ